MTASVESIAAAGRVYSAFRDRNGLEDEAAWEQIGGAIHAFLVEAEKSVDAEVLRMRHGAALGWVLQRYTEDRVVDALERYQRGELVMPAPKAREGAEGVGSAVGDGKKAPDHGGHGAEGGVDLAMLRAFYEPHAVIFDRYRIQYDRVVSFNEPGVAAGWSVTVEPVTRDAEGVWVPLGKPTTHSRPLTDAGIVVHHGDGRSRLSVLSMGERAAIVRYRAEHGPDWASRLLDEWRDGKATGDLATIGQRLGSVWLASLSPADFEGVEDALGGLDVVEGEHVRTGMAEAILGKDEGGGSAQVEPSPKTLQAGVKGSALDALSAQQREALVAFREANGRGWKDKLRAGWARAALPGPLQQIRNEYGPVWLSELTAADFAEAVRLEGSGPVESTPPVVESFSYGMVGQGAGGAAYQGTFVLAGHGAMNFGFEAAPDAPPEIVDQAAQQALQEAVAERMTDGIRPAGTAMGVRSEAEAAEVDAIRAVHGLDGQGPDAIQEAHASQGHGGDAAGDTKGGKEAARKDLGPKTLLSGRFERDEAGQYRRVGEEAIALVDEGARIRFLNKEADTFLASVELAAAKRWGAIEVTGSPKFRAEAWKTARLAGLEVVGYTPTEADLSAFESAKAERGREGMNASPEAIARSRAAAEAVAKVKFNTVSAPNTEKGLYTGPVVHVSDHHAVQDIGRRTAIVHDLTCVPRSEINKAVAERRAVRIEYKGGVCWAKAKDPVAKELGGRA